MKKSICSLLLVSISTSMASTPASTADVDAATNNLQNQINLLNNQINSSINTLTAQNNIIMTKNNALTTQNTVLENQNSTLTIQNTTLQTQNSTLTTQNTALSTQSNVLTAQNTALGTQNALLTAQNNELNALPAVAHPVGSCYGDGVVIYVNSDPNAPIGQQGLIAKLQNSSTGCLGVGGTCTWANPVVPSNSTLPGYFTGEANTNYIRTNFTNTQAANAAYDTTPAPDCPNCSNWYLPSQYELYVIFAQTRLVGSNLWTNCGGTEPTATTTPIYWSSTNSPVAVNIALSANVVNANTGGTNISSFSNVRAVRAF